MQVAASWTTISSDGIADNPPQAERQGYQDAHLVKCSPSHNEGAQSEAGGTDGGDKADLPQLLAAAPRLDGEPASMSLHAILLMQSFNIAYAHCYR